MNQIDRLRRRFADEIASPAPDAEGKHQMRRVRHEVRRRTVTVSRIEHLTPRMMRVHFLSPELKDFVSAAPDDHVKLFFSGDRDSGKPVMRDFTPRAFDTVAGTLTIDFALHDDGPASEWAREAKVGEQLDIGGPRGSQIMPDDFDWYLLIGDESALPAMGRRVEELRPGAPVTTLAVIVHPYEEQRFATKADWTPVWLARGEPSEADAELILAKLADFAPPPGDGFIWIAGEAAIARALRQWALETLGHPKAWIKAAGYWRRGQGDGGHIDIE
ncbi:MAG: siderophore-interacting protein [Alphaproteobacteria bacterium]